jgi:carbon starvation protein
VSALWVVVIGLVVSTAMYRLYAKRIDRQVIQADAGRATPATMYMDGVDFVPTSRYVLYGYHFKSIAAAGPIVGVITAANLWGWIPSIIWLMVGVSFIGWASDYSAIMLAVRNDGNSLSAVAHRLIAPRTRRILFLFIFFYRRRVRRDHGRHPGRATRRPVRDPRARDRRPCRGVPDLQEAR